MSKRVLVAEDDPSDAFLLQRAFAAAQIPATLHFVRDGQEAIDYLTCEGEWKERAPGNPAVILLDLKLPKIDGLEVLDMIRSNASLKSVPVVMLTSSREEQDLVRSYELGVNAYVVKPVEFAEFVEAISDLGVFWAVLNEPPPGSTRFRRPPAAQ